MAWSELEEEYRRSKPRKKSNRKAPKFYDLEAADDGGASRKEKKSGKRFHRKKTHKDDFLDSENSET